MRVLVTPPSTDSIRCDFARLHRDSNGIDECAKRKRQETSSTAQISQPPNKMHRGRESGTPSTSDSESVTTLAAARARGKFPASEAPREQTIEMNEEPVVGPITPAQHHMLAQDQRSEATVLVGNTTATTSHNGHNFWRAPDTPQGTQVVRETRLKEQPGLEVADNHSSPRIVRRGAEMENPFINQPQRRSDFSRRLGGSTPDRETDNIHYATRRGHDGVGRDLEAENHRLRDSRAEVADHLKDSTRMAQTLRTRLQSQSEAAALAQVQADLAEAEARARRSHTIVLYLASSLAFVVFCIAVYVLWSWVNGPEMQYVRKRRTEVLMESW